MIQFRTLLKFLGIDQAIVWAGGGRGLSMLLGPVGSFIIVWTLSPEDQGTYYLFLSLVSLQALFDLGASAAIAQMAPHLIKNQSDAGALPENEFIHVAVRWMNRIALGFIIIIGPVGLFYLHWSGQKSLITALMWLATVLSTAMTGAQEGRLKILYGSGHVSWTNKLRFYSLIIRYPVQWILLLTGFSLFSFSASAFAVFIFQHLRLRNFFPGLWPNQQVIEERCAELHTELRGLVGRASITYASGILVFNIQQPIIYKLLGPVAAAKLGFTGMVGSTLIGLASIWGMTRFPDFARQVAQGEINSAYSLYKKTLARTIAISAFGFLLALLGLEILHYIPRFSERLMVTSEVIPLYFSFFIQTIFLMTTYWPRSFRVEPFAPVAAIQMFVTPLAVWYLTKNIGISGVGWGNLVSWIVGAIGITLITFRYLPKVQRC